MKQEGQLSKKKPNLLQYAIQLVCILKWNKRDSFQKKNTPIYYSMLFNLCAYWNQTRWTDFKKIQLMTICYWTRVRNETRGAVFQKHTNYYCMLFNLCAYWNETRGIVFKKTTKTPIYYSMLFNKRGSFQKTTIYYCMLFNLCAYWNETRGIVFKKNKIHQFITVCYSTCVHIEMKQDGQISKKSNWWQYATELMCGMKQEGQFSKNTQIITVCYSTCVRIEMKQEGQFSKKKHQFITICYSTRGAVFKKQQQFITVCYSTCVRIEMKQEG